jgi:hypothetical protein
LDKHLVKISLGKTGILTSPIGYNSLLKFSAECEKFFETKIYVDFSELVWFDANMTVLLGAIIQRNRKSNGNSFFTDKVNFPKKLKILVDNGFLGDTISKNTNSIVFKSFKVTQDEDFMDYIDNELLSHTSINMDDDHKKLLSMHYAEIFSNVEKHANSSYSIFSCGQFYPKNGRLRFS